jgi:hypothetical protein
MTRTPALHEPLPDGGCELVGGEAVVAAEGDRQPCLARSRRRTSVPKARPIARARVRRRPAHDATDIVLPEDVRRVDHHARPTTAIASISTPQSFGSRAACTVERAGVVAEVAGVHLVHRGELVHVAEEDGGLHHRLQRGARRFGARPAGSRDLLRLLLDVALHELAAWRVERNLARRVDHSAVHDRLAVRSDRGGRGVGLDSLQL